MDPHAPSIRWDENSIIARTQERKNARTWLSLVYVLSSLGSVYTGPEFVITINVPVVFMARYIMVLRGATSLWGALEGVGPENRDFFGPWNGTSEASAIWTQKRASFHHKMKMRAVKFRGAFRKEYVWLPWLIGRASMFIPRQIHCI